MNNRYRLFRRGEVFYAQDNLTQKQISLRTKNEHEATRVLHAKNEAHYQPALNQQIARAYLSASDPEMLKRTWQDCINAILKLKTGPTLVRWNSAAKDKALDELRTLKIVETRPEHLLRSLQNGTVSTNVYLRRIHTFALDMQWLAWPLMKKSQWPKIQHGEKRGVTASEHQKIIDIELDSERKAYYGLLWHLGGAQSDIAALTAEDINFTDNYLAFGRKKTGSMSTVHFGPQTEEILMGLPKTGILFPRISAMNEKHRASEFKRRCRRLKITGITLHSYRYAWAERAKVAGYPERFAQAALGHNSKAVHRAYAKKALVKIPSLEQYEQELRAKNVVPVKFDVVTATPIAL